MMMKRKLAYGCLVLLTLVVSVTNEADFPRFLLSFELLFAVVMALWVHWIAGKLQVTLALTQKVIQRGNTVGAQIRVKNPTWFPVGEIRAEILIKDLSGWNDRENAPEKCFTIEAGANRLGADCWQREIRPVHCGLIQLEVVEVRVFDYIGLCSARIRGSFTSRYVSVLPHVYPLRFLEELEKSAGREGWQEDVAAKPGADTQEIFDTRLYQRGDTLRNIHWKLSAKEDDLMVKEFSMPVDTAFYILADCEITAADSGRAPETNKDPHPKKQSGRPEAVSVSAEEMDRFLENVAAAAGHCIERQNPCELLWYSVTEESIRSSRIEKEEDLYQALEELLGIRPYDAASAPVWESRFAGDSMEEMLRVTLDGSFVQQGNDIL